MKGYLKIRISGKSVERFINLCANKNINLWNLAAVNKSYEANIRLHDFKKLKPIVRKTKTRVTVTERIGFPFFLSKYRHRRVFFTGFIFCTLIILYLSTMVWNISLYGNLSYSDENILEFLKEKGIQKGQYTSQIDCFSLARDIRREYEDIIWVSVSIEGSKLNINMKENQDIAADFSGDDQEATDAYDIIADKDCKITSIVTRSGIPVVNVGDIIKKGDVLVNGQIPVYNDQKEIVRYNTCHADADIIGQTNISYNNILSLEYNYKTMTDTYKHEYFLQIGKIRLRLGGISNNYSTYKLCSATKQIGSISFGKRSVFPYNTTKKTYTISEIRKMLSKDFSYYCNELEKKGVVILQNNVKIYTWSDKAQASGTLLVNMPVGQKKISMVKEIGDSIDGNDGNNN